MVSTRDSFVIDTTFLFETAHSVVLGAPLLVVDEQDHTFLFCVIRDLLRLRRSLRIHRCTAVVGEDAYRATSTSNIEKTMSFLQAFGVPVVHDPNRRVLDICTILTPCAGRFVTRNQSLLVLADAGRAVIWIKSKNESAILDSTAVTSTFGICPQCIPAFLALTDGPQSTVLTRRQAVSLLQRHPNLSQVLTDPSVVSSRQIKHKLRENEAVFRNRLRQFTPDATGRRPGLAVEHLALDIENDRNAELLRSYQFHSLVRLLRPPPSVLAYPVGEGVGGSNFYHAVTTADDIRALVARIESAEACAVDTESSSKNPHAAELFGVSFSVKKGEAFYLPVLGDDLDGAVGRDAVFEAIKDIFKSPVNFVGHNIKYDYVLLRRYGLEIPKIHFDTMLAANECFGDWDLLNLPFLAKKLLGREIKSYKEIVGNDQTFLDVPFEELLLHACEDADVTLQLYRVLNKELIRRGLLDQYRSETLRLAATLGKWEIEGVPVDSNQLSHLRNELLAEVDVAKMAVINCAGVDFDPDAEEELARVLRRDPNIADLMGSRKATLRLLEDLAICHSLPRLMVKYRRVQKQLRHVEEILRSVENSKIYPLFSQTANNHGQLTTIRPRLFEDSEYALVSRFFEHPLKSYFRSGRKSLDIVESLSGDVVLSKDRRAAGASGRFLTTEIALNDVDQEDLLLSTMIGMSNAKLSRRFLYNRSAVASIRHDLEIRYSGSFKWLEEYRMETMKRGFALDGARRRWFDGLRSSNLAKREEAVDSAVRWLLRY